MKNMKTLSYEEIQKLIAEKANNIEATITLSKEDVAVMSKDDYYEPCVNPDKV